MAPGRRKRMQAAAPGLIAMSITILGDNRDLLGESPLWDPQDQALYWVDSVAPCIRRLDPATGATRSWPMPMDIGSIGLARPGHLVAGLRDGFYDVDLATGATTQLHAIVQPHGLRLNDGKMDRQGRYISGTLATAAAGQNPAPGTLYRLLPCGGCDVLEHGITVANATCFSPAGEWMYFADSKRGIIWRYAYDTATGTVTGREDFIDTQALAGSGPDGATVDTQGRLWVALVHAAKLGCFSPDGALLRLIDLPVELPTCPAFGGPRLDQLYITSISNSGRLRSDTPQAGALLRLDGLEATGLPEARFGSAGP